MSIKWYNDFRKHFKNNIEFIRENIFRQIDYCVASKLNVVAQLGKTSHTTLTVRNKHKKLDRKGEASFDIQFMIKRHAESLEKIMGALYDLPAKGTSINDVWY